MNFFICSKTVDRIRTKICTVILNHIEVLSKTSYDSNEIFYSQFTLGGGRMCAMLLTTYGWVLRNIAEIDQGTANCESLHFFRRHLTRFERKFRQPFYTFWGTYICNEINIVRLGFKKKPKLTTEQSFVNFFNFVKNSRHDSNEFFYSHSKPY